MVSILIMSNQNPHCDHSVCQTTSRCYLVDLITFQLQSFCKHLHESFPPSDKTSRHRLHGDTWWNLGHRVPELPGTQG